MVVMIIPRKAEWHKKADEMLDQGIDYQTIADVCGVKWQSVNQYAYVRRKRAKVKYEDKKEYTTADVDNFIEQVIKMQQAAQKLDTKQVKASVTIDDDKPIGVAYWGDWHLGAAGVDYQAFQDDVAKIRDTDGLYFIGAGDYKDNYITGIHPGSQFEQNVRPGLQDLMVERFMEKVAPKCLALLRGCHDTWDKKMADKDFLETLCEITGSVNLWHGGELNIKVGKEAYLWRCRHKYKYQSSLNYENAMRRIMETQGPCDVAAEAHLHNAFTMNRHIMGQYRILLRTGSYKVWDEFGQQIAGYKGKVGVPVVIMYPDRHEMADFKDLDQAIRFLEAERKG